MIEYSIDTSLHLLEVHINGSIGLLELVNFIVRAQKDPQYGPAINALFIVEPDADLVKLTPDSFLTFFRRVEGSGGSATWAIVASNESHRLILAAALNNFVPHRLKTRIFDDEFPALQWLKSNDAPR